MTPKFTSSGPILIESQIFRQSASRWDWRTRTALGVPVVPDVIFSRSGLGAVHWIGAKSKRRIRLACPSSLKENRASSVRFRWPRPHNRRAGIQITALSRGRALLRSLGTFAAQNHPPKRWRLVVFSVEERVSSNCQRVFVPLASVVRCDSFVSFSNMKADIHPNYVET